MAICLCLKPGDSWLEVFFFVGGRYSYWLPSKKIAPLYSFHESLGHVPKENWLEVSSEHLVEWYDVGE